MTCFLITAFINKEKLPFNIFWICCVVFLTCFTRQLFYTNKIVLVLNQVVTLVINLSMIMDKYFSSRCVKCSRGSNLPTLIRNSIVYYYTKTSSNVKYLTLLVPWNFSSIISESNIFSVPDFCNLWIESLVPWTFVIDSNYQSANKALFKQLFYLTKHSWGKYL